MNLNEVVKIVNAGPPVDLNTAGLDGAYVDMANYDHLTALVPLGANAGAATITVEEDADGSGAGTARAFNYRQSTSDGETLGDLTAATSSGVTTGATANTMTVIELKASELTDGKRFVRVRVSDPGAATIGGIIYLLSGGRYVGNTIPAAKA